MLGGEEELQLPELPEVETIKRDLAKNVVGTKITDVNFLWPGILKDPRPDNFKKVVLGQKVIGTERRAKTVALNLSNGYNLLFHMKMTGHLIITEKDWQVDVNGKWIHKEGKTSPLYDPLNQFIRVIFSLDNGKIIAFSDLRKFAYLKLLTNDGLQKNYREYGPEPLSPDFSEDYLKKILAEKKIAIKKVLMDQALIAGIGNIYADEILYTAKIHPLEPANKIPKNKVAILYKAIKDILTKAVELRGTSISDFRDTEGRKGEYEKMLKVYRKTGTACGKDGTPIKRIVVGGRGTHFCPTEQKLEN